MAMALKAFVINLAIGQMVALNRAQKLVKSMIGQTACAVCPIGAAVEFRFATLERLALPINPFEQTARDGYPQASLLLSVVLAAQQMFR